MKENTKVLVFDMDGTIADLYGVQGWLEDLRMENTELYSGSLFQQHISSPLLRL